MNKTYNDSVFIKIDCSTHPNGMNGPWSLGLPDVLKLKHVYVNNDGTYVNGKDVTQYFSIDNGQDDAYYGLAQLSSSLLSGIIGPNTTILVEVSAFTKDNSQGVGYFNASSYPIDDVNLANTSAISTAQIPVYTTSLGTIFDLRDCIDFRSYATNTAVIATSSDFATINPSSTLNFSISPSTYNVVPNSFYKSSFNYYLPRIDRAYLDVSGNFTTKEGYPALTNLQPPPFNVVRNMSLATINIPPYPSLSTDLAKEYNRYDYAVTISMDQIRRYTMKDIGILDNRITNLEYYTSLNALEQSAASLQIPSSINGMNRFKNGIFAEGFDDFSTSQTSDPTYLIAIDKEKSEARPYFIPFSVGLTFDPTNSTGCGKFGQLILLNHTSNNVYIEQNFASKYHNCIEGNVNEYIGTVALDPPGTISPSVTKVPDIVNNIDTAGPWIHLANSAWGTQWGYWSNSSAKIGRAHV